MMKTFGLALCFATSLALAPHARAADRDKIDQRIAAASDVVHELMNTPDRGIPDSIAEHATCVAVIPGFKKGAFVVGAEAGHGVVTCRTGHGWSAPAFIHLSGASFGAQIGGESTDLVLVAESRNAADRLLHDKIKLGADIAVAAGPVGRNSGASTTDTANAGFLTYSRSKGIFAGIDLSGDYVNQDHEDTDAFYGKSTSFQDLLSGSVPSPAAANQFEQAVSELFRSDRHDNASMR